MGDASFRSYTYGGDVVISASDHLDLRPYFSVLAGPSFGATVGGLSLIVR
jgi:hypothetical protein